MRNFFSKDNFYLFYELVKMDIKKKYLGTVLGTLWAFINPIVTTLIIFFVFRFGLKTQYVGGTEFLPWLICGLLAWFYISESISSSCTAIIENSHLVTKIKFPIEILPPVKAFSPLFIHLILMSLFVLYLIFSGTTISTSYVPQLIYYMFCSLLFTSRLTFICSAITVIFKDTQNLINIILQVLYWITPIFWDPSILPARFSFVLSLNPVYYIINGFRDSIFAGVPFWEREVESMVFWSFVIITYTISIIAFNRGKKIFSDVL
jgi:ABC-type polysaccharide/polyol phosphate export permease